MFFVFFFHFPSRIHSFTMFSKTVFSVSTLIALAAAQNNNNNNNNAAADSTTLSPNAIQTGSFLDGGDGLGAEDGQALSTTSKNNFINFCDGKTLTNGLQITDGSCNGIVMGMSKLVHEMNWAMKLGVAHINF